MQFMAYVRNNSFPYRSEILGPYKADKFGSIEQF